MRTSSLNHENSSTQSIQAHNEHYSTDIALYVMQFYRSGLSKNYCAVLLQNYACTNIQYVSLDITACSMSSNIAYTKGFKDTHRVLFSDVYTSDDLRMYISPTALKF